MKISVRNELRNSTKSFNQYNVCIIDLVSEVVEDGEPLIITIEDFKTKVPFEVKDMEIHIGKDMAGRFVINELNYSIPYTYNMGLSLLLMKEKALTDNNK